MNNDSHIIDGKYFAENILVKLAKKITSLKTAYNLVPTLAIILIGEDPASVIYVRNKIKAAERIGIVAVRIDLPIAIQLSQLLSEIAKLNKDPDISGIIVQLPLPTHIDKNVILSAIDPRKDVDGFHPINVGYLNIGEDGFVPSTALGCLELIKYHEPNLSGKNAVIIGRSNIVGKPVAALLLRENCTVTICHSKTKNLQEITRVADIVISAIGVPHLLTREYFSQSAIVIDVGINRDPVLGKLVGDVDFDDVNNYVRYITPVPGGVGPMTIVFLLRNTIKALIKQHKLKVISNE